MESGGKNRAGADYFLNKKADPCIAQGPTHQNKTKNQLFIL